MSLVGFRAKNHPQQAVRDAVDDRRTPKALFADLHAEHRFTVDAAASDANALLPRYWTLENSGLTRSWVGERVWCNPPYSRLLPWIKKAWAEVTLGGCPLVVMLLPANRTEQKWWQEYVEPLRDKPRGARPSALTDPVWIPQIRLSTKFLPGRLRFEWPSDRVVPVKGDRPPFGCVILTWSRS